MWCSMWPVSCYMYCIHRWFSWDKVAALHLAYLEFSCGAWNLVSEKQVINRPVVKRIMQPSVTRNVTIGYRLRARMHTGCWVRSTSFSDFQSTRVWHSNPLAPSYVSDLENTTVTCRLLWCGACTPSPQFTLPSWPFLVFLRWRQLLAVLLRLVLCTLPLYAVLNLLKAVLRRHNSAECLNL